MKALVTLLYFLGLVFGALLLAYLTMHGHENDASGGLVVLVLFMIFGGLAIAGWLSTT